jgi:endonuclease V-like protein UPF0215 family
MSIHDLSKRVELPVIAITSLRAIPKLERKHRNHFDISVGGEHVSVSAEGVKRDEAQRLYRVSCSPYGNTPEPVRIADLLAEELSRTMLKTELLP